MPKPVDPVVEKPVAPATVVSAPIPVAASKEPALPAAAEPVPAAVPQPQEVTQELVSSVVVDGRGLSHRSNYVLLNRILGGIVLALVVLVFYRVGSIQAGIAKAIDKQISGAGSMSVAPLAITEQVAPPLESYLDKVGARNIFQAKVVTTKEGGSVTVEATGAPKDLKLVAISLDSASEDESVAIIKNKADSKTYFVKLGQTVGSTEYVLSKIHADRVVLKQRKQEYELK